MDEVRFIRDQIRTTFDGRSWHGPNIRNALDGVDLAQARAKLLEERHSIWELVNHINYWMGETLNVLRGGSIPKMEEVDDWPPMGGTAEEWEASKAALDRTVNQLLDALVGFGEERLMELVPGRDYTYRTLLHGTLHHNLYHAGQISILKKKTRSPEKV
jgi:uncharacterized damage-inducible protein DinB